MGQSFSIASRRRDREKPIGRWWKGSGEKQSEERAAIDINAGHNVSNRRSSTLQRCVQIDYTFAGPRKIQGRVRAWVFGIGFRVWNCHYERSEESALVCAWNDGRGRTADPSRPEGRS